MPLGPGQMPEHQPHSQSILTSPKLSEERESVEKKLSSTVLQAKIDSWKAYPLKPSFYFYRNQVLPRILIPLPKFAVRKGPDVSHLPFSLNEPPVPFKLEYF